jgi:hypothetical protein
MTYEQHDRIEWDSPMGRLTGEVLEAGTAFVLVKVDNACQASWLPVKDIIRKV